MSLYLAKPDLTYYEHHNEMMKEWCDSGTQIVPWFLDEPFESMEEFAKFIQMLDDAENGIVDKKFGSTTSFFVIDENNRLIGATSLRHYLTYEGFRTWGHIGYGVRPSERRKGNATAMLKLMLEQAKNKMIYRVLIGVHDNNIGSWKTVEKCDGILENVVKVEYDDEPICRYWIDIQKDR